MTSFENEDKRMNEFTPAPLPEPKPVLPKPPGMSSAPNTELIAQQGRQAEQAKRAAPDRVVVASLWARVWTSIGVMISPRVDAELFRQRMAACMRCEDLDALRKRFFDKVYCGACQCPRWWPARLDHKNRRVLHTCPRGRHPGQAQQGGGCAGCGG